MKKNELPPWQARDARERREMIDWMNEKLDELDIAGLGEGYINSARYKAWMKTLGPAIDAADHGDIEPLRRRLPMIARFLVAPPPRKRKKRQKFSPAWAAAITVKHIRQIWVKEFKRKNRRKDDGPSAIEIAALRYGVSIKDVEKRLKPSGPSGRKKKISRAD